MANPHDKLFKKVLSQRSEAQRLIKYFLPKDINEVVDLETMELQSNSLLDDQLQEYFTDIVYKCSVNTSGEAKLCFLFEHKSYGDPNLLLQVLYYIAATYRKQLEEGKSEIIIPIIFIHGKYNHQIVTMKDMFDLPNPDFAKYLPTYAYELINVNSLTDADLQPIRSTYLLSMILAFQAKGDTNLLLPRIREMFKFVEQIERKDIRDSFVSAIASYLFLYFKLKEPDMIVIREALPTVTEEPFFSTADRLRAEGMLEGVEKGEKVGKQINSINKNIETTVNCLLTLPNIDDKTIAKISSVDIDFIHAVRRTFAKRLIKKRREHFYKFYAEVEDFNEKHQAQASELFETLRKKIKKSKVKIAPPPKKKK